MFSNDPAVYIGWCNVKFLTDQKMKPSCVQICPTAYHTLMGKSADFPGHERQNVHWK